MPPMFTSLTLSVLWFDVQSLMDSFKLAPPEIIYIYEKVQRHQELPHPRHSFTIP